MEPKDIFEVSDIREYIKDLDEDTLIEKVIIPLYQKRNFLLINRPSHGPGEHGKDIIFRKADFPKPTDYAIQAKAVTININNVGKIIDQAKAAFDVPFIDPSSNIEKKVDYVQVITSGNVSDDARTRFSHMIPDRRYINLFDGEFLIGLVEQTKKDVCKFDISQTAATVPSEKIPSNISSSPEFMVEKTKQLSWEAAVEEDLKKLNEGIREGKLPENDKEIVKVEESKFSKTIPLDTGKGQLLYYREITQRDTTRISIIPGMSFQSESIGETSPKDRPLPSLELSQKLKDALESLSEPERKVVNILNYCNGIDENALKCIMAVEGLDETLFEAIKGKEFILYKKEILNLPASFTIEKIQIIDEAQCHLSQTTQTGKKEINSVLIKALNVCSGSVPLILSIINEKYDELDEAERRDLLTYVLQNQNRSTIYFASRFSHKDHSLAKLGEEILSKDKEREHDHRTYFNFGSALLLKNTKDGVIIDRNIIDKNEIQNSKRLLEIACDMDQENALYIATLSNAFIFLGNLNSAIFNAQLALKKNENEPTALNAMAIGHISKRNFSAAQSYLEKLYKIKPESVPSLMNLGNVYKGLKMFGNALELFEQANRLKPNSDYILAEIGIIHKNLGNIDDALNALDKAIGLNPLCEQAWLGKGDLYIQLRDFPNAIQSYEKAIQINEKNPNVWVALAQSYDGLGNHEKAKKCIEEAIEKEPSSEFALLGLGAFYANKGIVEECEKWCGEIFKEDPKNVKALECIGVAYNNAKKFEKAIEFFDKALDIDPTQPSVIYGKAMATNALKNVQDAKKLYEDALKLDPDNIKVLLELSKILSNEGNYDRTLKLLSHAENESPEDSEVLLVEGAVYANKGVYGKAIGLIERSIKLNPKNVYSWLTIGKIYVNTANSSKAKQYFEKGLEIEPNNPLLLEGLGVTCLNLKLFGDSIKKFEQILALEPSHTAAHFYIAEAYRLEGNYDESIRYYEKLLKFEPNNRGAILGLSGVYISLGKMPTAKKIFKKLMKESNGDPQVPFEISSILRRCGKLGEAIYYLNKAIDADSKRDIFHIEKANIYLQLGKHQEAGRSYEKALMLNPKNSSVLHQMGINYLAKNNPYKAVEFLEKYIAIDQNNAAGWFHLGDAYNKLGNKLRAKECFESALQYGPLNAEMLAVMGDFYNQVMNDLNSAIICYEKAILLGREDSRIKLALATCYLNIREFDKCIRYCKDIINKEPENIEALVFESLALLFKEQYDTAGENLRKALSLNPNNYLTMLGLAFLYNNKEQSQEAIDWAKKGTEKEPHNPNNMMLYLIIGNNYNLMGNYEDAITNFEHARRYKPDYPEVLRSGGFPFRNLKRYKEAIDWWREYLKLRPDDWEFWSYLGVTYGDNDDFKNGIECLERAISLNDSEKGLYYALGIQYSKSGNYQKAIQTFQKLKNLDPTSSEPWLHTGDIYFNVTNEFEKAISEYLDAMNINPNNWKAWANLYISSKILDDNVKEKEYMERAIEQCPDKVELFIRETSVFLRLNRINDAEQSVENGLTEFPESHILWFLKAGVASINKDIEKSTKSLERAIYLNRECINFAFTEPNLEYLRMQDCFKDLIGKYCKNLRLGWG
ncbi:Beta-barrel assembly-enhancing protease [uncultured archaeon]|nr:Beta-barrel assembly-enhancing protease [uncultured archaeon]